ncbi:hypothetical protein ACLKA7_015687 [Drosophila subpalustris]
MSDESEVCRPLTSPPLENKYLMRVRLIDDDEKDGDDDDENGNGSEQQKAELQRCHGTCHLPPYFPLLFSVFVQLIS